MNASDSIEEIIQYAHYWNWGPDWQLAKEIYHSYPNSYSILTPFAYSYLEELIRSLTSEYGIELLDTNGNPKKRKLGRRLIELKAYFIPSTRDNQGDNRHSVAHGYMHPRFWSHESFEKLIQDTARLSKFAGF